MTDGLHDSASSSPDCALIYDGVMEQLNGMQKLYEFAQASKGKKPPTLCKNHILASFRAQRHNSLDYDRNQIIFELRYSKVKDLSTLRRISVNELLLETWHKGRYLICRTIEEPCRANSILTVVEDHTGQASLLSLYSFTKNIDDKPGRFLPVNTILVIKEPYYALTAGPYPTIRCDSPSDVVIISYQDENYKKLNVSAIIKWDELCAAQDRVYASPQPRSPLDWKQRGNDLYKSGHLKDAARAYSIGISSCSNSESPDPQLVSVLTLNRSAAYFEMGRFDDAVKDAELVLETSPENVKALSRAARSYYKLREFQQASKHFRKLVKLDPSSSKDFERCLQRLKEEFTGRYDWDSLRSKAFKSVPLKGVRFDVADYFNSDALKTAFISQTKGRGVIAKRDIPPGTLLVVEKAFAASFNEEIADKQMTQINFKHNTVNYHTRIPVLLSMTHQLLDCPSRGRLLYDLWSGEQRAVNEQSLQEMEGLIDFELLYKIHYFNLRVITHYQRKTENGDDDEEEMPGKELAGFSLRGSGLWLKASLFNHSCVSNTAIRYMGDVMIIVSTNFIKAGDEITTNYISASDNFAQRQKGLAMCGFQCYCYLCLTEAGLNRSRLDELNKRFNDKIVHRALREDIRMIPILEKHIAAVKKVYAKNSQNRFMFSLTRPVIALAHLYRVHNRTRDYLILFEKAFMYFSNIRDVDAYLKGTPSDEPVYFSPTFMFIVRALVSGYSKLYNPMRWLKWGRLMLFLDALQGESDECTREKFTELMQELNINEKLLHDERIV